MKTKKKNRHREFLLRRRRRRCREELPHELPQVVVGEILKRLPVRSVLRFRCVSRSWRSTVDDPHFAALHWSHFPLDARDRYLACLGWDNREERLCSLIPDQSLARHSRLQIEIPFFTPANCYSIVGSCDGLIFVEATSIADKADSGQTMYLWNPFTGKHKAVPRQRFPELAVYEVLGLGFDARSNDYKIVKILYFSDPFDGIKSRAEIYSLHTDSWKSLKPEFPTLRQDEPAVFFNGNLHWFATICGGEGRYKSIISFDVADEVVNEMALPVQISHVNAVDLQMYMAVLDNSLAVFISSNRTEERYSNCSVWVMKDYGMHESWTSHTFDVDGEVRDTFEVDGGVTGFDGFMRNGELLMNKYHADRVSVNLTTGQYTELPISTPRNLVSVVECLHLNLKRSNILATK